jgi:hypothetical protein
MKLESPGFEKRMRKCIRAELQANRKQPTASKPGTLQKPFLPLTTQAWFSFFFAFVLISFTAAHGDLGLACAALALWTTATAFRRGFLLQNLIYGSADLETLYQLPISDADIFSFQWMKYLRQSTVLLLNLLVAYCGLAVIDGFDRKTLLIAIFTATVQCTLIVALAVHIAAWTRRVPLNAISSLLSVAAFVLIFFWSSFLPAIPDIINLGYWSSPSGWVNYASMQSARAHDFQALLLLLPVGLIVAAARASFLHLRTGYSLPEPVFGNSEPELNADNFAQFVRKSPTPGETEIQDRITSRDFIRPANWPQLGWIENVAARMMSRRQRLVIEFLVAGEPRWTGKLRWGMVLTAISSVAVLFFGEHGGFIVFFPAYLIATALLPLSGNEWRGLQCYPTAGLFAPIYSMFPVSYDEILTVVLKVNVIRCAAAFPMLATYGAISAAVLHQPALLGITLAAKVTVSSIALQPLFFALRISSGTNDTRINRLSWHLFWVIPLILALATCLFVVFNSKNDWMAAGCLVAASILSLSLVVMQRRLYRLGKFDLLSMRGEPFQN